MPNESVEMNKRQELTPWKSIRVAVTGGTSGLGLALVRMLLDQGARVAFIARNRHRVERLMRERADARGITGDVSQKDDTYSIAIQILGEQLHGYGPRWKEAANRGALWQRHRGHGVPELRRPYWRDGSSAKSS